MRWVVMVLAALTLLLVWPGAANAQSIPSPPTGKPTAADEATAKKNFETGVKLYGEGSYAEALIAFEQSYRVGGHASALKNIALSHRSLKHFVEAYEAMEQMLSKHDAQISAADKKAVQQALDEIGVLTATVQIDVNEADAEIEIDGKSVGRSPMTKPKRVAVSGSHSVRVTKPTFARFEQTFTVDSQQNKKIEVKLELEKTVGHLVVREQNGRDVHVFVDSEDRGPAPWEGDVAAGEHTIEAKGPRFAAESRKVHIAVKDRVDVVVDAQPLLGHLRVTTVPATATISIDGSKVGAGSWDGDLPEGSHRIEVSLEGQPPQVRDVMVGRGQSIVQEIPIIAAIAGRPPADYRGIYVKLTLQAVIGAGPASNAKAGFTEEDKAPVAIGGGIALRIGYALDWYAAEVVGAVGVMHLESGIKYTDSAGILQTRKDQATDADFFFGIGGRVTSKDEGLRFTFGIAPGIAIRNFSFSRQANDLSNNSGQNRFAGSASSGSSGEDFKNASYTAPGLLLDGGMLVGRTPGTKFYLGVTAWIDFPPNDIIVGPDTKSDIPTNGFRAPGRGIVGIDSVQFYVGPTLGMQFGH